MIRDFHFRDVKSSNIDNRSRTDETYHRSTFGRQMVKLYCISR